LDRLGVEWKQFRDTGAEFRTKDHPYLNDLDIFGQQSLFQLVNITNTYVGRQTLRSLLDNPQKDIGKIQARQKAVKELSLTGNFIQALQCAGMVSQGSARDPKQLIEYTASEEKLFSRQWIRKGILLLSMTTVAIFLLGLLDVLPLSILSLFVVCQGLLTAVGYIKVSAVVDTVSGFRKSIKAYEELLRVVEQQNFHEYELIEMQELLRGSAGLASQSIKKLEYIAEAIEVRYNMLSYILLNFLLLWDYHCVFALESWKKRDGIFLEQWFSALGYFEAIASLANLAHLNPMWSFPAITEERLCFDSQMVGHPLIDAARRVSNDFAIHQGIGIITGSNMSGKTTMLRTVGINLVLAYAGAPVCAEKLTCSLMDIFTSMRISDDLGSGISTFYAELLRIKKIIEHSKMERPMIFLIDEVFRGTNSNDRITGALSVLKNLNKRWVMGLVSTHDFELCSLENDVDIRAVNYHFMERYLDRKIYFDYAIRPGRCYSTNAKYLMQMVGIELIE
jgi:DNA mismatch repair ATPase MutS